MEGRVHSVVAMLLFVMVVGVLGGQTTTTSSDSSSTPNSWTDCMAGCPGYNCQSFPFNISRDACNLYCAGLCAIPPSNLVDEKNHYCNLGCTSSKCFNNYPHNNNNNKAASAAVTLGACINECSHICTTYKPAAALA